MKHNVIYRYLLLFMLSLSISGIMFFSFSREVHAVGTNFTIDIEKSTSSTSNFRYVRFPVTSSSLFNWSGLLDPDSYYNLSFDITFDYDLEYRLYYFAPTVYMVSDGSKYFVSNAWPEYNSTDLSYIHSESFSCYIKGSELSNIRFEYDIRACSREDHDSVSLNVYTEIGNLSIVPLDTDSFDQASYDQGYSAGLSQGHEDGYQSGYDQGYMVGEADGYDKGYNDGVSSGSGYDNGFEDGISVGYQEGYNAGYDIGKSEGFELGFSDGYNSGYTVGYDDAMERIESWGADGSEYPLIVYQDSFINSRFSVDVYDSTPFEYRDSKHIDLDISLDPNHTYKFAVSITDIELINSNCYHSGNRFPFYLNVGGIDYLLSGPDYLSNNYFYIPGDRISDTFSFDYVPICIFNGDETDIASSGAILDFSYIIYDMGPAGNLQNQIANQTDDLTNGFDTNEGNAVNDDLSNSLDSYHDQENSIFTSVKSGLDDFEFYNFEDSPALIAGITFVSSIMTSWFNASGGIGGVGILLSVLFSIVIASMALGLYRYYQSRGKGGKGK